MPLPMRKKKPAFEELSLEEEPIEAEDEFEEDYAEDDEFGLDEFPEDPLGDPLAADGDMMMGVDPEQAALAETLGFTEPDQQQALIDLIKLVATPPAPPMEGF